MDIDFAQPELLVVLDKIRKEEIIEQKPVENQSKIVQITETLPQSPNLNTISAPGPHTEFLPHSDSVLDKKSEPILPTFRQVFVEPDAIGGSMGWKEAYASKQPNVT